MTIRRREAARLALRSLPVLVSVALATTDSVVLASAHPHSTAGRLTGPGPYAVSFEPNVGQFAPDVLFRARAKGTLVTLRDAEIDVRLRGQGGPHDFLMRFEGATSGAHADAAAPSKTVSRYYLGAKSYGGAEGIEHASKVRVSALYPGVDLVLHGNPSRVEYDLEVAPGSDPSKIRYRIDGADRVAVEADGSLAITSNGQTLRQLAPVAWQERGGMRDPVPAHFKVDPDNRLVEFDVGEYDRSRRLVIDPVLDYSTFLGGTDYDYSEYIGVGASGDIYMASADDSDGSLILTKFDPVAREVLSTTVVSGSGMQLPNALAVGSSGSAEFVYVAGLTTSPDFPYCLRPSAGDCVAPHGGYDGIALRFNSSGALDTSWILGGSGDDVANGIAVDGHGSVYVTGWTEFGDFPTTPDALHHRGPGSPVFDTFVVRIDEPVGPVYSTVLGGSGDAASAAWAIAADPAGNMHIVGQTDAGGYYLKMSHDGHSILDAQIQGIPGDVSTTVAVDSDGYAVLAGYTAQTSFSQGPTSRPFAGGNQDAFVVRYGPHGFSTLLGGSGDETPLAIGLMGNGDVIVGGSTTSGNFPQIDALPIEDRGQMVQGKSHGFVTRLSDAGVSFSTTIGGSGNDHLYALVPDGNGVIIAGDTTSANFPVANAFHGSLSGTSDSFLARIAFGSSGTPFDFDGNLESDLLWSNTDGRAAIWLMDGTDLRNGAEIIGAGTGWNVSHVADFDGDGHADLVWRHDDGRMAVYLMNGLVPKTTTQLLNAASGWSVNKVADFNGDGKADMLFQNDDGSAAIWLMDGTRVASGASIMGPATGWAVTKVADFDGDGKADLLWTHADGRVAIWLMDGLTVKASQQILNAGSGWSVAFTADLDGNGKSDIVWANTDGSVAVWLMDGATMTSGVQLLGAGTGFSVVAAGDLNGDGKADLLLQHTDGRVVAYLMNGLGSSGTATILGPGTGWSVRRMVDLNGDGEMDIVWQNTDGSTAVWLMDGLTLNGSAQLTGSGTGWTVSNVSR
ncbi:MAG TPA: FG-GAP-like repeat-containing protein [Usitatibacter sp.]|nr:FG-GAP-like repeat-containing protein [Usitatibacter sp.]